MKSCHVLIRVWLVALDLMTRMAKGKREVGRKEPGVTPAGLWVPFIGDALPWCITSESLCASCPQHTSNHTIVRSWLLIFLVRRAAASMYQARGVSLFDKDADIEVTKRRVECCSFLWVRGMYHGGVRGWMLPQPMYRRQATIQECQSNSPHDVASGGKVWWRNALYGGLPSFSSTLRTRRQQAPTA